MGHVQVLPKLRKNLKITRHNFDSTLGQRWKLYDPLKNCFYVISNDDVKILNQWENNTLDGVVDKLLQHNVRIEKSHVLSLFEFLKSNELLVFYDSEKKFERKSSSNLLFNKFPITPFYNVKGFVVPFYGVLTSLGIKATIFLMFIACMYFLSSRWSEFLLYSEQFYSYSAFIYYFLAIAFVKFFHEMSHAYTAFKYGVSVGNFGVLTFFGIPLFYTDLEQVEKLISKKKRIAISLAGIKAEIAIAIIATFFWFFIPDGNYKDVLYVIASSSWIMSLFINLNPLAKFDGYYVLSDLVGVENLHTRSGDFFVYNFECFLFGMSNFKDDFVIYTSLQRFLFCVYGALTKLYKVFIVISICLVLYILFEHIYTTIITFFVFLFFVVKPLFVYLTSLKGLVSSSGLFRKLIYSILLFSFLLVFFMPIDNRSVIPAVLYNEYEPIYTKESGLVTKIHQYKNRSVSKEEHLIEMSSIEIDNEYQKKIVEKKLLEYKIDGAVSNDKDKQELMVLYQQLKEVDNSIASLQERKNNLSIFTQSQGYLVDTLDNVKDGFFLTKGTKLGEVLSDKIVGVAYINDVDNKRLILDNKAIFYPNNNIEDRIFVVITKVENNGAHVIDEKSLISINGGEIITKYQSEDGYVPNETYFKVYFKSSQNITLDHKMIGMLSINVKQKSYFFMVVERFWKVLLEELRR